MRIMVYSSLWGNAGCISSTVGVGVSGFRGLGFRIVGVQVYRLRDYLDLGHPKP